MNTNSVRRLFSGVLALALFAFALGASAATTVHEATVYARGIGEPETVADAFSMASTAGEFTLLVQNRDSVTGAAPVTSALVSLNGQPVGQPKDIYKYVVALEHPVALQPANTLAGELCGGPGTFLTLRTVSEDVNTPP
jgi:hypothetical protein